MCYLCYFATVNSCKRRGKYDLWKVGEIGLIFYVKSSLTVYLPLRFLINYYMSHSTPCTLCTASLCRKFELIYLSYSVPHFMFSYKLILNFLSHLFFRFHRWVPPPQQQPRLEPVAVVAAVGPPPEQGRPGAVVLTSAAWGAATVVTRRR